ncbi:DUF4350 domain-containing protein [Carboxylicivirga sp. A043]|uniref:DUF4350 domain-containing protein n=1 Tax=Carboxylicivirga litoralis TaxID=2816963 RepID=UPI0021CB38C8|nr:DUF4350 domain-containing protein [Carboxylicivirga sp. A043]MCU4154826.1 DUF4350 domain-containing protein [Carboxylicivirga sp. A043]
MGKRSGNITVIGVPLLVVIVALVLAYSPKPIDWSLSYSKQDTQPYGSKLLFDLLPTLITTADIKTSHGPVHEFFDETTESSNLVIINKGFYPEPADIEKLEELLFEGHHVFIAAQDFSDNVKDWLNIDYHQSISFNTEFHDSISFNLANRKLQKPLGYWYKKGITNNYFNSYDTLQTSVLGINNSGKTNFIRIKQGEGWLYINLNPQAFTNYQLLKDDNADYAFKCLSYLPDETILWDEHYKIKNKHLPKSQLSFILNRQPLRLAWYVLLIGIVIFFLFESARRQRVIPIVKPHINSTVTFIETIGRLYFSRKNHLDIAQKRFSYLQEYIRSKYYINTSDMNEDLFQQLSEKSSLPIRAIRQLFELGENLKNRQQISEEDLEQFNRRIEFFYDQCR